MRHLQIPLKISIETFGSDIAHCSDATLQRCKSQKDSVSKLVKHRILKPHELAPLLRFKKPQLNAKARRLAGAHTIADLRAIAKRRIPAGPFDYADGAAEGELSIARARQAFKDIEFTPSILRDVSEVDTSREVLGARVAQPFGIAPTGFTRMLHAEGEVAGASVAGAAGIPFALSTMGTTSIPNVQLANPHGRNWLQLYMWKDRQRSISIIDRAAQAGFDTLLVTVDVPVSGARLRDFKNGFSVPPQLTLRTIANAIPRPEWWFNFLTTDPPSFAVLESGERMDTKATLSDYVNSMFDPSVDFNDLKWIRDQWPGKVVVKGIQNLEDARAVADLGMDGIVLSNHGGRQLDRAPIPFHLLPSVVKEVGADLEVHLDTGIMSGADIVAALALGAHFTLVGRAYLYGLMAGGKEGVERAVTILSDEIARTMRLLGVTSLDELEPSHVRQLNI